MGFFDKLRNTVTPGVNPENQIDDEIRFHVEERVREYVAGGMTEAEARRQTMLKFGGASKLREETRDADVLVTLDAWLRDARIAARGLSRRPGLVAAVVGSLAIGIALNSSVFSVVDAVLLKPLPFPRADEVWMIQETLDGNGTGGNPARFRDYRERTQSFSALAGFYGEGLVMTGRGNTERITVGRTFGAILPVLGTEPVLGRGFTEEEQRAAGQPVVVLMHSFWKNRLGADANIVGQSLSLSKKSYVVVGVLPEGIRYPEGIDAIAAAEPGFQSAGRSGNWFQVVGRLKPGVSVERANAEMGTITGHLAQAHPETDRALRARLEPLREAETREARRPIWLLMSVVGFVLLIACLNIASLLVTRAAERTRETAIRASLGAGRLSLARLFFLESMWLALAGGALGLVLAYWGVDVLKNLLPAELPRLAEAQLNGRVALFTLAATMLCGLSFGVLPSMEAAGGARAGLALREGRGSVNSRGRQLVRRILVASQAGLSVVLLVGAALAARGFLEMRRAPLGYQPEGRLAVSLHFPWSTPSAVIQQFNAQAFDEFSRIPGVRRVGLTDRLPLEGESQSGAVSVYGLELPPALRTQSVARRSVSSSYFGSVGQPLITGRLFEDRVQGASEAVVNQEFVERYLAGVNPLGQRVTFDVRVGKSEKPQYIDIVGVVGNVRKAPLDAKAAPSVYSSYTRNYWPMNEFVLETEGSPDSITPALRAAVKRIDPNMPVASIRSLQVSLARSQAGPRVQAILFGAFALGALLLASLGLYGLLSSDVLQRTQEIGVRLALGASPNGLVKMLVRQGASIAGVGLAIGLAGAVALSRGLAGIVPGIPPLDWMAPAAAALLLISAAVLASLIPARRAARVDPAVALRRD